VEESICGWEVLKKHGMMSASGFNWLRIGSSNNSNKHSASLNTLNCFNTSATISFQGRL